MIEAGFQVLRSDGTIRALPEGYYWREQIGPGHYGPQHGPFLTEAEATANASLRLKQKRPGL